MRGTSDATGRLQYVAPSFRFVAAFPLDLRKWIRQAGTVASGSTVVLLHEVFFATLLGMMYVSAGRRLPQDCLIEG
jgi:hypothetical protein